MIVTGINIQGEENGAYSVEEPSGIMKISELPENVKEYFYSQGFDNNAEIYKSVVLQVDPSLGHQHSISAETSQKS